MHTWTSLLLAMDTGLAVGLIVAALVVGAAGAVVATWLILKHVSKKKSEKRLDETSRRVEEMIADAQAESKRLKKEAILESKEQELKRRNEFEQEM